MADLDNDKAGQGFGTGHLPVVLLTVITALTSLYADGGALSARPYSADMLMWLHPVSKLPDTTKSGKITSSPIDFGANMFASKTVFVLGAGASSEAGLPTGLQLKEIISDKLHYKFDRREPFGGPKTGDHVIFDALREYANQNKRNPNDFLSNARWISEAMPQAISIDNFLDAHSGNAELELCGKVAIAQSILEAEANSTQMFKSFKQEVFDPKKLNGTWYQNLFMLLSENIKTNTVRDILSNVSFIVFNYDRCIEHFLYHSIQNFYHLSDQETAALLRIVNISHPYGVVGRLDWQDSKGVPFGSSQRGDRLIEIGLQIKTFTERVEDETTRDAIRQQIQEADTIVFLGFAFHLQNLELIAPEEPAQTRRVFATALGISGADVSVVQEDISRMLKKDRSPIAAQLHLDKLDCAHLISEYWRTLSNR